jgi:hypothetical protein
LGIVSGDGALQKNKSIRIKSKSKSKEWAVPVNASEEAELLVNGEGPGIGKFRHDVNF